MKVWTFALCGVFRFLLTGVWKLDKAARGKINSELLYSLQCGIAFFRVQRTIQRSLFSSVRGSLK